MCVLKSIQVLSFSGSRHLALVLIIKTAYVATNNLKLLLTVLYCMGDHDPSMHHSISGARVHGVSIRAVY